MWNNPEINIDWLIEHPFWECQASLNAILCLVIIVGLLAAKSNRGPVARQLISLSLGPETLGCPMGSPINIHLCHRPTLIISIRFSTNNARVQNCPDITIFLWIIIGGDEYRGCICLTSLSKYLQGWMQSFSLLNASSTYRLIAKFSIIGRCVLVLVETIKLEKDRLIGLGVLDWVSNMEKSSDSHHKSTYQW